MDIHGYIYIQPEHLFKTVVSPFKTGDFNLTWGKGTRRWGASAGWGGSFLVLTKSCNTTKTNDLK